MRAALALGLALAGAPVPGLGRGAPSSDPPRASLQVEPRTVKVGMLFRGIQVRVEGTAPPGYRLSLVCVGKASRVELKRKEKAWNVVWRNAGSLAFERVPSLYLASADLEGARLDHRVLPAHLRIGLGFEALEAQVLPTDADEGTRRLFREFVRLKVEERLYSFSKLHPESASDETEGSRGIILARLGRDAPQTRVAVDFSLPASVPPGVYEILMIGYRDGTGEILASETLTAERVGLARFVSSMAERHGLLHGILSVLLAIGAGFLSGVLFAGPKKGH
jgi:Putative transmembrane protein (Alph_Pro_TM)